ncbi:MAG: hypothetical protein ACYSUD_08395 [Planctomycetota bacterium]
MQTISNPMTYTLLERLIAMIRITVKLTGGANSVAITIDDICRPVERLVSWWIHAECSQV